MAAFYDNLAAMVGDEKAMEIAKAGPAYIALVEKEKRDKEEKLHKQKIISEIISGKRIPSSYMDIPMTITKDFDMNSPNGSGPNKDHVLYLKKAIVSLSGNHNKIWTSNQIIEYMKNIMKIPHFKGGVNNDRVISLKDNLSWVLAKMFAAGEVTVA